MKKTITLLDPRSRDTLVLPEGYSLPVFFLGPVALLIRKQFDLTFVWLVCTGVLLTIGWLLTIIIKTPDIINVLMGCISLVMLHYQLARDANIHMVTRLLARGYLKVE